VGIFVKSMSPAMTVAPQLANERIDPRAALDCVELVELTGQKDAGMQAHQL
jgi:hypothetical protein